MRAEQSLYDRLDAHAGILKPIKPFYADVRQHNVLGPIFNSHISTQKCAPDSKSSLASGHGMHENVAEP